MSDYTDLIMAIYNSGLTLEQQHIVIRALERDKKARQAVTVEQFIKQGAGIHREDGGAYAEAAKVCSCSITNVENAHRKYF
jgi:hypothetical protein